ncbi:antitoxin Xre-like helix-turn-helix domain-containing protein [Ruegeria halocynthiae]
MGLKKLTALKEMSEAGELTRAQMAKKLKVSRATLQRKLAELSAKKGAGT